MRSRILFFLSVGFYAVSFILPTFALEVGSKTQEPNCGLTAFLVCMVNAWGVGGASPFIAWLANPAFWLGAATLLAGGKRALSLTFAGLAVLLGMSFLFQPFIYIGYYVWLTSFVLLAAANAAAVMEVRHRAARP